MAQFSFRQLAEALGLTVTELMQELRQFRRARNASFPTDRTLSNWARDLESQRDTSIRSESARFLVQYIDEHQSNLNDAALLGDVRRSLMHIVSVGVAPSSKKPPKYIGDQYGPTVRQQNQNALSSIAGVYKVYRYAEKEIIRGRIVSEILVICNSADFSIDAYTLDPEQDIFEGEINVGAHMLYGNFFKPNSTYLYTFRSLFVRFNTDPSLRTYWSGVLSRYSDTHQGPVATPVIVEHITGLPREDEAAVMKIDIIKTGRCIDLLRHLFEKEIPMHVEDIMNAEMKGTIVGLSPNKLML